MAKSIYSSLKRLKDFPIDETSRFETLEQANYYCLNDKTAYIGQFLSIYNDNRKAAGGEDKNGVYIIINSLSTPGQKELLRATDTDAIDRLTHGLSQLSDDLGKLERKLGEDIEVRLQSFASLEELAAVNKKIDDLIGLENGERLEETLDTIKEISDWILNHTDFVNTILDINERVGLINAQNELLRADLNRTSSTLTEISREVNTLRNAGYITGQEVEEMIKRSAYGHKEIDISTLTSQRIPLPNDNLLIDKITVFIRKPCQDTDVKFRIFTRDLSGELEFNYITNDDYDTVTELYETSHIDVDTTGNFLYVINDQLPAGFKLLYEITYGNEHLPENDMEGTIGITYYTVA